MSTVPAPIQAFAVKVSNTRAEGFGLDWRTVLEVIVAVIEMIDDCPAPERALARWNRRLNGRFAGFWADRAQSRIAEVASTNEKAASDAQSMANAIVTCFRETEAAELDTLIAAVDG